MMEENNGKWVNVDFTNRLDENYMGSGGSPSGVLGDHPNSTLDSAARTSETLSSSQLASTRRPSSTPTTRMPPSSLDGPNDSRIQITVCEPMRQGEGMNAYISYKICTSTDRPQFTKSSFSVIRRYSDFVWLHSSLCALYPGVVVPPLPEKLLVGRFSPEFIESRRRALQLFLLRCCIHPELQHNPKNAPAKGSRGTIFQWIDDTVQSISTTLGSTTVHVEKTSADLEIDEMIAYIEGLEPIMTGLHKHSNRLSKRGREIADGLFEFGMAFNNLGKSEENDSLQAGLCDVGECADKLSILAAEHAEKEALNLEEPIADYIRLVGAVKAALQKRNDVRLNYGAAVADLENKTAFVNKLIMQKSASEQKLQIAESDVMKAQQKVDDAKLEYDIVTERVIREVERFKRDKLVDFKRIILDYIQEQVEYSRKVEEEWHQVIPKLAQIRIESDSPRTQSEGSQKECFLEAQTVTTTQPSDENKRFGIGDEKSTDADRADGDVVL